MRIFDTIAANDIAERVVDKAVSLDGILNDSEEAFQITPNELRLAVTRALEDYSDAQPEVEPAPVVSHKRHVHKPVERHGMKVCEGCGAWLP